jgi:hypothetical protein
MSTRRKTRWGTDRRGRYTRRIGWKRDQTGKLDQPIFYLGTDPVQARRREDRLVEFWQHIEQTYQGTDRPLWNSLTLEIGREIGKGNSRIVVERNGNSPESYARYLHRLGAAYPMVQFVPDEPKAYEDGADNAEAFARGQIAELERQMSDLERKHVRIGNLAPGNRGGMLHEALDVYIGHIKESAVEPGTDRLTDGACARVANAKRLKERHDDIPLSSLTSFDAVQGMVNVWRNRPLVKNSNPPRAIKKKTAEHHIGELMRFFRWLARTNRFDWRKPEHFDELETRVRHTAEERQARFTPTQVDRYTLDELKLLNQYATPTERLLLLLGLNCGFGAAEQGRLTLRQLYLNQQHPHADLIRRVYGFESSPHDSFLFGARPKSGVYGEWYLWSQTVEILKWVRQKRERIGNASPDSLLIVGERGRPFFHQTAGGNRGQTFNRRWSDLTTRIRADHARFPTLSFGKLRKTAGDLVRDVASGEIASVFLCHGHPVRTDDLLDLYTNRPFGKVFEAIKELEKKLEPVFDAAPTNLFALPDRKHESLARIEKILKLHDQGNSIREIAAKVGLSKSVVGRHLEHHRPASE